MPRTQRTPPATALPAAPLDPVATPLTHLTNSDSAPNLLLLDSDDQAGPAAFMARFNKRKRFSEKDEIKASIDQLNKQLTLSMTKQEAKLVEVMSTVNEIKQQNVDIVKSIAFLMEENSDLKKKLKAMEGERKDLLLSMKSLEDRNENLERCARSTGLELRNFPQKTGETKKELLESIIKIGDKIHTPITQHDIKDVFRTKSKGENKPIIVEFTSVIKKEEVIDSLKKFKKERNGQIDSSSLGVWGPNTRVFISETLTLKTRILFTSARDFAKSNSFKFCWTSRGTIYIRKTEGQNPIRIATKEDLERLRHTT